eukprot:1298045-Rhodomonas_salina.1
MARREVIVPRSTLGTSSAPHTMPHSSGTLSLARCPPLPPLLSSPPTPFLQPRLTIRTPLAMSQPPLPSSPVPAPHTRCLHPRRP